MQPRSQSAVCFLLAVVTAASMWFYADRILVPYQRADAAAHNRPRGNLSDLYPRWLGTRELLLHHRNPYSEDITKEIQRGYYGRELDPNRPNDPRDQEAFAYPIHVVFLLAPLIGLPFSPLRIAFHWLLTLLTAATVVLWLRVLRWRLPPIAVAACIAFTMGSFPAVQGIKLQQLSLLVAAFLAGAAACAASDRLVFSGVLLALATIKPQIAWPLAVWLLLWALSDWRARRKLPISFGLTLAVLLAGAEILLPGWWRMFAHAMGQYHQYTQNQSVLELFLNAAVGSGQGRSAAHIGAQIFSALAVLATATTLWRLRKRSIEGAGFGRAAALVLALTVLVVPMSAPYNQVLLLPAILLLVRERNAFVSRSLPHRLVYNLALAAVAWQWAASLCLTGIDLLSAQARAFTAWSWPLFAMPALPVLVFSLIFVHLQGAAHAGGSSHVERSS